MLLEAKGQVAPGAWGSWLHKNFDMHATTARIYMRWARIHIQNEQGLLEIPTKGQVGGSAVRYSPILTTAEQPVWSQAEVQARAAYEAIWSEGTIIQATITVQGWMRPSDNHIWQAGSNIRVWSPMAMLDMVMKVQSLTFMQSRESGTETVLAFYRRCIACS
jgi:prophage tail gpP-like protein